LTTSALAWYLGLGLQNRQHRASFTRIAAIAVLLAFATPATAGAWTWPVAGPVLQGFAFDPENPLVPGQHRGIDIQGAAGDPVLAPAAGTVTFAGRVAANGSTITIRTADYAVTLLHLGSFLVAAGAIVAEGQPVALVDTRGEPAHPVPYVQLGVRLIGDSQGYLDPLGFLPPLAPPPPAPAEPPAPAPAPAPSPGPAPAIPRAVPSLRTVVPIGAPGPRPVLEPSPPASAVGPRPSAPAPELRPAARPVSGRPPVLAQAAPSPVAAAEPAETVTAPAPVQQPAPAPSTKPWLRAHDPEPVFETGEPSGRPFPWKLLAAATSLLAAAALAARSRRKAARIIEADALLPDDTHLLRQCEPAHRARVHDDRGRRPRSASPAARRGDLLPHGH
jgi:hypothetical protein